MKVCMDEQMLLDLNREAIRQDRKLSDYLYLVLRGYAYGNLSRIPAGNERPEGE